MVLRTTVATACTIVRCLLAALSCIVLVTRLAEAQTVTAAPAASTPYPQQPANLPENKPTTAHYVTTVILCVMLAIGMVRLCLLLRRSQQSEVSPPSGMVAVECAKCLKAQYIARSSEIFICFSCRVANQVAGDWNSGRCLTALQKATFERISGQYWRIDKQVNATEPLTLGAPVEEDLEALETESTMIPSCVVCMDQPGNMCLLPCAHSGLCEGCAKRIMQQSSSRSRPSCPTCREPISTMMKLTEIRKDVALGEEVRVPVARKLERGFRLNERGIVIPGTQPGPGNQLDRLQNRANELWQQMVYSTQTWRAV